MLSHVFIAVEQERVNDALQYFSLHGMVRRKLRRESVSVDDELILSEDGIDLFTQIQAFSQHIGQTANRLDYYGKTIFPPECIGELLSRMQSRGMDRSKGWKWLYLLIEKAHKKGQYIVHLGI